MVHILQNKITLNNKNLSFEFCLKIRTDFPDNPIVLNIINDNI